MSSTYRVVFFSILVFFATFFLTVAASVGTIDPFNAGNYKAKILNPDLAGNDIINFGKFTTQSSKNISISNTEVRGYAWGNGVGWIVMNCADTTSGCSSSNGNFKVVNDGNGVLSGYAWGENTGWINFGPFTSGTSQVKISQTTGNFIGTNSNAGYAWSQNFGWIMFDCAYSDSCTQTDWRKSSGGGGDTGGGKYACNDGLDNDGDGKIDYPNDPGCINATDNDESDAVTPLPACSDGVDNDSDGKIDYPADPGCTSASDTSEVDNVVPPACSDGIDNDGDGKIDYPDDPGCMSASDTNETDIIIPPPLPACSDGSDNDGDGKIDYPADPGCVSATDNDEADSVIDPCVLNPNDPSCKEKTFCELNPTDPSCGNQQTFCQLHPTDPACTSSGSDNPIGPGGPSGPKGPKVTPPDDNPIIRIPKLPEISDKFSRAISTLGIGVAIAAPIVIGILSNPFSFYDIFLVIARLWSLLLIAFGLKKRNPPWGTVYDSVTKQPLDPAYVVLTDLAGQEIASAITDLDGRYGFAVPAGTYLLSAKKSNYAFPSEKLRGKDHDELYNDLYFGEQVVVKEDNSIIAKNIPMDQLAFDWNEYAKKAQGRMRFFKQREIIIRTIADVLFAVGFAFSIWAFVTNQTTYNTAIVALYVFLMFVRNSKFGIKAKGAVLEKYTGQPLGYAIVRVNSIATGQEIIHKVADQQGKYYCLVQNGDYHVVVDKKLPDGTYEKIPTKDVSVKTGHLHETFEI